MAGRLPKVTEYIKNIGKSVAYASIEVVKEPSETITDFMETNEDLFKVIYSASKNYRQTMRAIDRSIKKSKIYDAANSGFKALKEDLRTGKFYNKERETRFEMESFGEDFADFSEFESDDLGIDFDANDTDMEEVDKPSADAMVFAKTSAGLGGVISEASRAQSNVIASSAEAIANINMASAKMLSMQNERIHTSIISGFAGVSAGLNLISSIMNGPMINYMNESTKFYGDISNKINETNAYLKELTEMQRNLYKKQEEVYKQSRFDEITSANGTPDLMAYAKNIYKNIKDLDPTGGMFSGGDENMFKMFVGSPLKAIPMMIAKAIIPSAVTSTLQAFDQNMSGLFSAFITRMNSWAEEEVGEGINIKGIIGRLLGIKIDKKTSLDTSKYTRGPIPFDGETKKAIVDVIPAYLARIESAISGMPERIFDGKTGTFKTVREVHRNYRNIAKQGAEQSVSSMYDDFDTWAKSRVNSMRGSDREKTAYYKKLKENFRKVGERVYADGGDFQPFAGFGPRGERLLEDKRYSGGSGMFEDDEWLSFMRYMNTGKRRKAIYDVSKNTIDAINRANRSLEEGDGFMNPYTVLFDGRLTMLDKNGRYKAFRANDSSYKGEYTKNSRFKSATDYLKDILAEIRWIRTRGIKGGGGGSTSGGPIVVGPNGTARESSKMSFEEYYKANFGEDTYEDEYVEDKEMKWSSTLTPQQQSEAAKYGLTRENLKEMEAAKTITDKWAAAKRAVDKLLHAPAKWAVDVINKADQRIFDAMFGTEDGETFRDKHGLEYRGLLDYMVGRVSQVFDEFKDKMKTAWGKFNEWFKKTAVGKWVTEKGKAFAGSVRDSLKSKFGYAKNRVRESWDSTYGALINRLRRGEVVNADDVNPGYIPANYTDEYLGDTGAGVFGTSNGSVEDLYDDIYGAQYSALGRVATKYGLTMLSPGEIVIPNPGRKKQMRNLSGERKEKSRLMQALKSGKISHNATGTKIGPIAGADSSAAMDTVKKVMHEIGGKGGDIAADALIGSGVSLITGLFGGPLIGAAAGAGYGLIKNSETVQKALFGEIGADGERQGGFIGKETIKKFTEFKDKNGKSMIDFGIAGGILSLITPMGLVGGMLTGATFGYVKNTSWFQEFMFGNEEKGTTGIMSQETKKKIEKAFPKMAIGAGAGILLGPFGLVGNTLLGATAGYVTTTDTFKKLLLGEEDENGKRKGGILGAAKAGLVDPLKAFGKKFADDLKDYAKKNIIEPTKSFLKGSGQFVKNIFVSVGDRVADGINGVFAKHLGLPIEEFLREKVFKRLSSVVGTLIKLPITATKAVIGAPFKALGAVGNTLQAGQIARGTMDSMTAQERLDFRDKHKVRFARLGVTGRDKTKKLDSMLAGASEEELAALSGQLGTFIKNRGQSNIAYNNLMDQTGSAVSDLFDENGTWASRGHGLLSNAYNDKKAIMKAIYKGDFDKAAKHLRRAGMDDSQIAEFMQSIDKDNLLSARAAMIQESGLDEETIAKLEGLTGYTNLHKGGNRYIKQFQRLTNTELKYRKAQNRNAAESGSETVEEDVDTEAQQLVAQNRVADNTSRMIDLLIQINNSFNGKGAILDENGKPIPENAANKPTSGDGNEDSSGTTSFTDADGTITRDAEGNLSDDKQTKLAVAAKQHRDAVQQKIADSLGNIGNNDDEEEEEEKENPSLISRIFGAVGGVGSKLMGIITGGGIASKVGIVAAALGGAALIGYGSEFVKNQLMPALEKSPLFQKIAGYVGSLIDGIKDGSLFVKLGSMVTQGMVFATKNVIGPLAEGIVTAFPDLVKSLAIGIGKGIKNLFTGSKEVNTDYGAYLKNAASNMPIGKDESSIAADFSGGTWVPSSIPYSDSMGDTSSSTNKSNIKYTPSEKYETNSETQLDNGSVAKTDSFGNVSVYDKNGEILGTYNQNTGDIITTSVDDGQLGVAGRGTKNAFVRGLATGKAPALATTLSKVGSKLFSTKSITKSTKKFATSGFLGKVIHGTSAALKGAGKVITGATSAAGKAGATINNAITSGWANTANKVADKAGTAVLNVADSVMTTAGKVSTKVSNATKGTVVEKLGKTISQAADKIAKSETITSKSLGLVDKIISLGKKVANSEIISKIISFLGTAVKPIGDSKAVGKIFEELFEKIANKAASTAVGKMAQKGAEVALKAAAGLTPLAIITWGKSFIDGTLLKTETLLGISKNSGLEIGIGARCAVGILNMLNDNLLLGLIPLDWLARTIADLFEPILGFTSEELEEAQKKTSELLTQAGIDAGRTVPLNEYNEQEGILGGLWKNFTRFIKGEKAVTYKDYENDSSSSKSGSGRSDIAKGFAGKGRGGQQGGIYAGMKYGNSTIGKAGCAPVAAASMLGGNIPEAANFAQRTGHVAPDGSTDIGYFGDYFSAKGIPSRTTSNKSEVNKALSNGNTAIMLGRDPGGGYDSAYSDSSHYITAKGAKDGSVIVNDPAIGVRKMPKSKVMRNMKASVIAGKGREANTAVSSANSNVQKIISTAKGQVGTKEGSNGNNKYGAEYGLNYQPWCCIFVWWVFKHAGGSALFYGGNRCASCTTLRDYYSSKGQIVSTIKPGDLIFFNWDNGTARPRCQHIGIATSTENSDGTFTTIEGNTSSGSSGSQDNGGCVAQKTRKRSQVVSVARPAYAGATFDDAIPDGGSYDFASGSPSSTDSSDSTGNTLFDKITSIGTEIVKKMYGEDLYNLVYGDGQTTDESTGSNTGVEPNVDSEGNLTGNGNDEKIWNYLRSKGYSKEGTAAVMGSLYKESGLLPNNLQNSFNKKFGLSDADYTSQVNSGKYSKDKFANDSGGYGLAQWTYHSRKANLYDATVSKGRSISSLKDQLDLLDTELANYGLSNTIKNATNISDANRVFTHDFERPAGSTDYNSVTYTGRLQAAQGYYDKFKGTGRGYANRVNTKYTNERGRARDDSTIISTTPSGTTYNAFLQNIISILLSIADNTDALSKILDILSKNFNIDMSSDDVKSAASNTRKRAREALGEFMSNRTDANELSNILQTKDTDYLVKVMSSIAQE